MNKYLKKRENLNLLNEKLDHLNQEINSIKNIQEGEYTTFSNPDIDLNSNKISEFHEDNFHTKMNPIESDNDSFYSTIKEIKVDQDFKSSISNYYNDLKVDFSQLEKDSIDNRKLKEHYSNNESFLESTSSKKYFYGYTNPTIDFPQYPNPIKEFTKYQNSTTNFPLYKQSIDGFTTYKNPSTDFQRYKNLMSDFPQYQEEKGNSYDYNPNKKLTEYSELKGEFVDLLIKFKNDIENILLKIGY